MTLIFFVSGLFCGSCARTVETRVRAVPGVRSAELNFSHRLLRVEPAGAVDGERLSRQVEDAVRSGGFEARRQQAGWLPGFLDQLRDEQARAVPAWLLCLVFFFAMWSSTAAFAGYLGELSDKERWLLAALSTALGMPALGLGAWPFAMAGARSLFRARLLTLDLFVALGAFCAAFFSARNIAGGSSQSYVDSSAMVLTVLLGAKIAEGRLANRTARGILDSIHGQDPLVDRLAPAAERCRSSQIRCGDLVSIPSGHTVVFDGVVVDDSASLDSHLLSGEPTERILRRGDPVEAGDIARTAFTLRVERPVGSRLFDSWAETALCSASRSHRYSQRLARLESRLTLIALCASSSLGILTFLRTASLERALETFFIGVLIFCPCLFASILPYAKQLASLSLVRHGVFCHRVDCLFDLWRVRHFVFDKTGTLESLDSSLLVRDHELEPRVRELLESLRQAAPHPILEGLELAGSRAAISTPEIRTTPGQGVEAVWPDLKENLSVGRAAFVLSTLGLGSEPGDSRTLVARDGRLVAEVVPGTTHQAQAVDMLRTLRRNCPDLSLLILSGDPRPLTGPLRDLVEEGVVSYLGNLSPQRKAELVPADSLFVGDGLNDILALARADVSVRAGTRARGHGAVDLELRGPALAAVASLPDISRRFVRVLIQTAAMAAVYNLGAWTLAAFGWFTPLGAVCAMLTSLSLMALSCSRLLRG